MMGTEKDIDLYLNAVINEGLYSSKGNLQFQMNTLFRGIKFKNKKVLDVGGGFGLYSFYAACSGAEKVVCLEPEVEGSSSGMIDRFNRLNKLLKMQNIVLKPVKVQALVSERETFDIILLHNSINHLDEMACINLIKESRSKDAYRRIFSEIYSLSNHGAKLIICDCTKYNFFALLKIPNPFASTIEWHKHQSPKTWANLLIEVGFVNPKMRWSSFNIFRNWGRVLFGNKLMAYFLKGHFCLTMDKT
jgi:SAM-dependent methyltransferase